MRFRLGIEGAVLGAGVLVAAALLLSNRWEIAGVGRVAYRLDHWTGEVRACHANSMKVAAAEVVGFGVPYQCDDPTAAQEAMVPPQARSATP